MSETARENGGDGRDASDSYSLRFHFLSQASSSCSLDTPTPDSCIVVTGTLGTLSESPVSSPAATRPPLPLQSLTPPPPHFIFPSSPPSSPRPFSLPLLLHRPPVPLPHCHHLLPLLRLGPNRRVPHHQRPRDALARGCRRASRQGREARGGEDELEGDKAGAVRV